MMKEKKRNSYTVGFRKRATELAMTSDHPTSHVARILKLKESTLANWVAREKQKQKSQEETTAPHTKSESTPSTRTAQKKMTSHELPLAQDTSEAQGKSSKRAQQKRSVNTQRDSELPLYSSQISQELEKLRKDNQRLRREKEVLREALFLMGSSV